MTTFLLLLKCFFQSILSTLLRVVLPSVTILLLKYCFKILFTPLLYTTRPSELYWGGIPEATAQNDKSIAYSCLGLAAGLDVA